MLNYVLNYNKRSFSITISARYFFYSFTICCTENKYLIFAFYASLFMFVFLLDIYAINNINNIVRMNIYKIILFKFFFKMFLKFLISN